MVGDMLTNRQNRAVGLDRLDRLALAGKRTILWNQNPGGEDNRQSRYREHGYRKERPIA